MKIFTFTSSAGRQIGLVAAGASAPGSARPSCIGLSRLAGRPLLVRYGRYILMPPEKIEKSERWMAHYGSMGIFISRGCCRERGIWSAFPPASCGWIT